MTSIAIIADREPLPAYGNRSVDSRQSVCPTAWQAETVLPGIVPIRKPVVILQNGNERSLSVRNMLGIYGNRKYQILYNGQQRA